MTSTGESSVCGAFATPDAGVGYFGTAEHYRHVGRAVVDYLHRGGLVLVTGDPPVCLPMLIEALRKAAPRPVIEVLCDPALDFRGLCGVGRARTDPLTLDGVEGEGTGWVALRSPLYVFADADRLSDAQIECLLDANQAAPPDAAALDAAVVVAHSSFLGRLEGPAPHPLEDRLAAHLRLQRLDRDEVEAFIRYQLPPSSGRSDLFTAQRVALIAIAAGGDPAVVNRFARGALEMQPGDPAGRRRKSLPQAWRPGARNPVNETFAAERDTSTVRNEVAPSRKTWREYAALKPSAGRAIVCVSVFGLMLGALSSRDLSSVQPNPRIEEASARVALPVAPLDPMGSLPAGDLTLAAVATDAAAKPLAAGGGQSRAAPVLPLSAPRPQGSLAPDGPRRPADEIAALMARGDAFVAIGDITSARLFFQRAADAGDGRAAMRLAVTLDPTFLDRAGVRGFRGDPEQAAFWYRRALDLGEAKTQHEGAPAKGPPSQPR